MHTQRRHRNNDSRSNSTTCTSCSHAHPKSHWPIKSPSPQAQRSTGAQWQERNTNYRLLRNGHPVQAHPRTVPGELQSQCPGVEPITLSHWEQLFGSSFGLKGGCCQECGICGTHGMQGERAWDCSLFIVAYLRDEPKARREDFR